MLNVDCYSAPQLFRLPYQHTMIVEDFKNVRVFAIESQSEDESTRDLHQSFRRLLTLNINNSRFYSLVE